MNTVLLIKKSPMGRFKEGAKDTLYLVRSPDSLYLGLKKKWLAPTLLLVSLVLVPTVFVPVTHHILEKLYPPIEKKQFFGLVKKTHVDERLEVSKAYSNYMLWGLAGIGVFVGLIAYAPIIRVSAEEEKLQLLKDLQLKSGGIGVFDLEKRYRIDKEIGSGAMGVVFSAFDKTLQRQVALKELPSVFIKDAERRERFRREALTLAKLTHPGIVSIYDLLDDGERMVLVMELVCGGTLEDLISCKAPLSVSEVCRLGEQVCETLDHVRQNGIIHRDLKPANILIDEHQNLKVTDFGMARLVRDSGLTLEGSVMGTPHYMSPEQAAGKSSDYRSDIYSLGVILYEMLSGAPPFEGELTTVLLQQISDPPPPLQKHIEGLDADVEKLVMAMLEKDPAKRLSDYSVILSQLKTVHG